MSMVMGRETWIEVFPGVMWKCARLLASGKSTLLEPEELVWAVALLDTHSGIRTKKLKVVDEVMV